VAIPSVRDTAHTFTASGAAPEVILHTKMEPLFPFQRPSQTFIRVWSPFTNLPSPYSEGTACAFAGYFVRRLPLYSVLPQARGLRHQSSSCCARLSRAPTTMPPPTACWASEFR